MTPGERALLKLAENVGWERAFLVVGTAAMAVLCVAVIAALIIMAPAVREVVRDLLGRDG